MFVSAMTHHLALVLACKDVADADNVDYDALDAAFKSIAIVLMAFLADDKESGRCVRRGRGRKDGVQAKMMY
jgi:hypothetical protein